MKQTRLQGNSCSTTGGQTLPPTKPSGKKRRLMPEAVMPAVPLPALDVAWAMFDALGFVPTVVAGVLRAEGFDLDVEKVEVIWVDYQEIKQDA